MKKLITILAILTVLVGAIFASEDVHQIKLTVTIPETVPSYILKTTSGAADASATAGQTSTAALSEANKTALLGASGTADVGFAIQQVSNSRTLTGYTMTVNASNLVLVSTNDNPKSIERTFDDAVENATANEKFTVVSAAPNLTKGSETNIAYTGDGTSSLHVQYNGVMVAATTQAPVSIGTFTVGYNANATAKPGNYVANVKLTVTAD